MTPTFQIDRYPESGTLSVLFTARRMAAFSFRGIAKHIQSNRLLLRDPVDHWYNSGIPCFGATIHEVAMHIETVAHDLGVTRIRTAGSSMGGYAAILFGSIVGAERCVAFSPQTILDPRLPLAPDAAVSLAAPDLLPFIKAAPSTAIEILIGGDDIVDHFHAYRLASQSNVNIMAVANADHLFTEMLAKRGDLQQTIGDILEGKKTPAASDPVIHGQTDNIDAIIRGVSELYFGAAPASLGHLMQVADRLPAWAGLQEFVGRILLRIKQPSKAEIVLRRAVTQRPDWALVLRTLAQSLLDQSEPSHLPEVEALLRKSITLIPTAGWSFYYLADCLFRSGRRDEAELALIHGATLDDGVNTKAPQLRSLYLAHS